MYCVSGFLRFFRSLHSEQIAQLHPGFMQLGLAVAYRTAHDSRDLIMFVTFDVVKHKDRTIAGREVVHLLCPFDESGLEGFTGLLFWVGQVAFSGRTP